MKISSQLEVPADLPWGKQPQKPLAWRLVGPKTVLDTVVKTKISDHQE